MASCSWMAPSADGWMLPASLPHQRAPRIRYWSRCQVVMVLKAGGVAKVWVPAPAAATSYTLLSELRAASSRIVQAPPATHALHLRPPAAPQCLSTPAAPAPVRPRQGVADAEFGELPRENVPLLPIAPPLLPIAPPLLPIASPLLPIASPLGKHEADALGPRRPLFGVSPRGRPGGDLGILRVDPRLRAFVAVMVSDFHVSIETARARAKRIVPLVSGTT